MALAGLALAFLLSAPPAADSAPVLENRVRLEGIELQLNGAGYRNFLFLDIYQVALYLPRRLDDQGAEEVRARVIIDPQAVLYLLGTEMDYKVDKMQAQFVFNNPNQISACGCGESVQLTPAKIDG